MAQRCAEAAGAAGHEYDLAGKLLGFGRVCYIAGYFYVAQFLLRQVEPAAETTLSRFVGC
jgi:hypothetical protein